MNWSEETPQVGTNHPQPEANQAPVRSPETYQTLLDSEHTLPRVKLEEPSPSETGPVGSWRSMRIYNEKDELVGTLILSKASWPGTTFIVDILRSEDHEHHRYGRAAYLELVKQLAGQGVRLISGNSLSRDAVKQWEWMVEKGAARLVLYREPNERAKNYHYSTSMYEII